MSMPIVQEIKAEIGSLQDSLSEKRHAEDTRLEINLSTFTDKLRD